MATTKKDSKATASKAAPAPKGDQRVITILGQPEKPFRATSARGVYWERVQAYAGKTVADLQASVDQEPPSQPKKGKLAGTTEPLSGWLSWFTQRGLIKVSSK